MKRIDCFIPIMNAEQVKNTMAGLKEPTPRAKVKAARKVPSAISTAATL